MAVHEWSFEQISNCLKGSKKLVVVELYMPSCHPCKILEATLATLSEEFKDDVIFCKCRFDEYDGERSLDTVPQLSIHAPVWDNESKQIKYGRILMSFQGVVPAHKLRDVLNEELDKLDDVFEEANA